MRPVRSRILNCTSEPLARAHSSIFSQGQRALASCRAWPSRPPPGAAGTPRQPQITGSQRASACSSCMSSKAIATATPSVAASRSRASSVVGSAHSMSIG